VDVGISFEENVTVARFYWLLDFESPTSSCLISALNDRTRHYFPTSSHDLPHQRRLGVQYYTAYLNGGFLK
jgi:hypothetical protein